MKALIYGAGPIGQWLALRLTQAEKDVTLLARNQTFERLHQDGIAMIDGLTGEKLTARPKLIDRLEPDHSFDLIVVAMQHRSRLAVCPQLARNLHLQNVLLLGNDVGVLRCSLDHLPKRKLLLGFPGVGGGWRGNDLVVLDRESPNAKYGKIFFGEIDGVSRERTRLIGQLFESADIETSFENDMDGWLKYHFAFMAPTAGIILKKGADLQAVAADPEAIHLYCQACREAGNVLRKAGYRRRQPRIFNLYYWLPRWLEPLVFSKLFGSTAAEIRFGLHARTVGPELLDLAREFELLKTVSDIKTPALDELIECVRQPGPAVVCREVA